MPTTYKFQVSMPLVDLLPRNRLTNVIHMEHITGGVLDTDLEAICADLAELWQGKYNSTTKEVQVKAYDLGPPPNNPLATVVVSAGNVWPISTNPEVACCLSFAGDNRGDKRRRGRIYLMPHLNGSLAAMGPRPTQAQMDWVLSWYTTANASLPDIGGVDWKFGVWSRRGEHFTQATQAWCNDEWDHQRSRQLRETTRVTAQREG